jgi:hypothetical protein
MGGETSTITIAGPQLPRPRGPMSAHLLECLRRPPHELASPAALPPWADPLADEDLQLALYVLYELHYRGFAGVDDEWEWNGSLLDLRRQLEDTFGAAMTALLGAPASAETPAEQMDLALHEIVEADDAPSLARYIECRADVEQFREALIHRSAYQLKEADPHAWALPRLWGVPKSALNEILADEYGGGRAERMHSQLYADVMDSVGLDASYGAYLDRIPGPTLATVNLMSWLGLHRRRRGAIMGQLALAEITSSLPNGRWANGVRRLGFGERTTAFFDEHVLADSVHDNIAAVDLAGGLVRQDPTIAGHVLWGARAFLALEDRFARHILDAWSRGESSLLAEPLPAAAPA